MVGQQKGIGKEDVKETVSEDFFIVLIEKKRVGGNAGGMQEGTCHSSKSQFSKTNGNVILYFFFSFTVFPPLLPEVVFHKSSY